MFVGQRGNLFDLALAEQAGGTNLAQFEGFAGDDFNPDRLGEADRLLDAGVERAQPPFPDSFRDDNERPLAPGYSAVIAAIEDAQASSSAWASPARSSGWPGCRVEMACL